MTLADQPVTSSTAVQVYAGNYKDRLIFISNTGSNAIRFTLDNNTPTATSGIPLAAGATQPISTTWGESGLHNPIIAIAVTGSTTVSISTDS